MKVSTTAQIETFVSEWVAQHVPQGIKSADMLQAVDHLAAGLTRDARMQGISGKDIFAVVGDIDGYLIDKCEKALGK